MVLIDGKRLRQVLENLLSNANRHTENGTITLACVASLSGREAVLDFVVEDTGEGIDAKRLQVIFEPFVRGATSSAGHGLGLSICRELVRLMGGDIAVTSTPGRGSRFTFSLRCPMVEVDPMSSPPAAPSPAPAKEKVQACNDFRVLLVDDDRDQLDLLGRQLEEEGFHVERAFGGRDAITQFNKADWHAVITDQVMPEVDGWAVLSALREATPAIPVILLSAVPPQRPAGFPAGTDFDAVLSKSVSIEDVVTTTCALILKVGVGETALDWRELARLANEGEVSAIEEWITSARAKYKDCDQALSWIERELNRLALPLLARVAEKLASVAPAAVTAETAVAKTAAPPQSSHVR
jgi:CheY-like chemotaxis protein